MSDLLVPNHEGIPEDDNAEPNDAGIEHTASPEEVDDTVSEES